MKGLSSRRTAETVSAFVKKYGAKGPRRAVLCTYDFDPARFHAVLLPELTRVHRWFRTLVLCDAGALQQSFVGSTGPDASLYELAPVRLKGPGVFHPKLFLLQAGAHILVGAGSANLTAGGLGGNLELMLFASNDGADGRLLASSAASFLRELQASVRVILPKTARRFLARVCASLPCEDSRPGPLLHSLSAPLLDQMRDGRPRGTRSISVVSPWHSSTASTTGVEPKVVSAIRAAFKNTPVIYTEGVRRKAPPLGANTQVRVLKDREAEQDGDLDASEAPDDAPPRRATRLHAKAYLAVGARRATLWVGSANCTNPALLRPAEAGGNVELLVRVAMTHAEARAVQSDLDELFEEAQGVLAQPKATAIPVATGMVLCGRVAKGGHPLVLELLSGARRVRVARARGAKPLVVSGTKGTAIISGTTLTHLCAPSGVPPSVLWEVVGASYIPFPVSQSLVPDEGSAEELLTDLLDELAGRTPASARGRLRVARQDAAPERDTELELLTKTEHQGQLDRLGVRVALLRRHLRMVPRDLRAALTDHYAAVVGALPMERTVRGVLLSHLVTANGSNGS